MLILILMILLAIPSGFAQLNIKTGGATGNGTTIDGPAIQAFLKANPENVIVFPAGTYVLNNANGAVGLTIGSAFTGTLFFAKGAKFQCMSGNQTAGQCIWFNGAANVSSYGMDITYANASGLPNARNLASGTNALLVQNGSNLHFYDTSILGSPGSGIWDTSSTGSMYRDTVVLNTTADGQHFENCQSCKSDQSTITNAGDDSFAITQVAGLTAQGIIARGLQIYSGHARGILLQGESNLVVSDFDVEGTAYSCVASVYEGTSYNTTSHVLVTNGICKNPGQATPAVGTVDQFCADIGGVSYLQLSQFDCNAPKTWGISVYNNAKYITVSNTRVTGAGSTAFNVNPASNVILENTQAYNSGGTYSILNCTSCSNFNHVP